MLILFKVLQSKKKTKSTVAPLHSQQQEIRDVKKSSKTAILFTLSIVFLVTTSPVSIYLIGEAYWIKDADDASMAKLGFWWAVVNMLMYTKNSINFLLYCLSGTKFRKELFRLINWKKGSRLNNENMPPGNVMRRRFDNKSRIPTARSSNSQNFRNGIAGNITNNELCNKKNTNLNYLHPNTAFKLHDTNACSMTTTTYM
ncbi:hypothetical protein DPMN_068725 [Dreissena polymorpha]|uniref:G-protein coupled receptors family 1 profile domain-containing protein n=1 Tax=Dreissena polymorpha TaxID=45954 RepID=A0A9D4BWU2_DREPO|nr:hypothetical protein DPMN_068725 [Dreissena polymorpha]